MFAWNAYESPRVDPDFICHHLNVNPTILPRKQPSRCSSKEYSDTVNEEVNKLKYVGAIKKVFYPEWLANIVVVKKKNGKCQVCVDFTDLNKACPKDPFSHVSNRPVGGCNCTSSTDELPRRLSKVPSDTFNFG